MDPALAAMVCIDIVGISNSVWLSFFNVMIVNGVRMINETSLVMIVDVKNVVNTRMSIRLRVLFVLVSSFWMMISKMDRFLIISMIIMIMRSSMIVCQFI